MKRKLYLALAAIVTASSMTTASAQYFDRIGANLQVGTNGISVEAATNISKYVNLRVGADFMPDFGLNTDTDYTIDNPDTPVYGDIDGTINLHGAIGRVQGHVIFNVYPAPKVPVYIAVGGYFGGNKLVKINGHSDEAEEYLRQNPDALSSAGAIIGDMTVPFDENGDVSGGLKVNSFRPYFGIGWGRAIPEKRINFGIDLGVQLDGTPELYTDYGELDTSIIENDNTYQKIIKYLKVYPVLSFKLQFRAL